MSRLVLPGILARKPHRAFGANTPTGPVDPSEYDVFGSFTADTSTNFLNPERGQQTDEWYLSSLTHVRGEGVTLVRTIFRLDDYRTAPIPASMLANFAQSFANARAAGVKLLPRFTYNMGYAADAPLSWVLTHIGQVGPVLRDNADVLAGLQAGFIGAWGEWHSSTNGLTSAANKQAIATALLNELPASRMIQIRTPYHIVDALGGDTTALTEEERFTGTNKARIGFKNDCFMTNSSDAGTYTAAWHRTYAEAMAKYTLVGGESCEVGGLSSYNDCTPTLEELETYAWDYLSDAYYGPLIAKWQSQGCWDDMQRNLGYRFRFTAASGFSQVTRGATSSIAFTITNDGYGKVYNPRPMNLVFDGTGGPFRVTLYPDARRYLPLAGETVEYEETFTVPAGLTVGASYDLHLELPDGSASLASDVRYSIRFANVGVWDGTGGWNSLDLTTEAA